MRAARFIFSAHNFRFLLTLGRLAWPVIATNLLQSILNVVDVLMVGRLGPISIAAIGMSNVIRFLVLVLVLTVSAGGMSLIAQARGARDPQQMSFVTRQSISSGLLLSLGLILAGQLLAKPLLLLANSNGDPQAVIAGTQFLRILFWGMPFLVLNIVFDRLMQGAGDTLTPLILSGGLNLANIGFNALFIFGYGPIPALGLNGAAYGTLLARGLAAIIGFGLIYSGRNVVRLLPGSYRPNLQMFKDIFTIGLPSGIQGVFRNGSRLLVLSIITSTEVGTFGAAALAIGLQIESLAFMPVLGLNVAATSLVGQELGRWQTKAANRQGNFAIGLGVTLMILLITPMIAFAPELIALFDPSAHPLVARGGVTYLRISTLSLPFTAVAMVANGAMRGAGDTIPGMLSTFFNRGLLAVAASYVLAIVLGMGSLGVWIGIAVGNVADGISLARRWRARSWIRTALHKTQIYRQHLVRLSDEQRKRYLTEIRAPQMAQLGTQEVVSSEKVVYSRLGAVVEVIFSKNDFRLVDNSRDKQSA